MERRLVPIPANETERLAALRDLGILDTPAEEEFDRIARLAAAICDTPFALISLVDEERLFFKSSIGLSATETPREYVSFCAHAVLRPEPFLVPDASRDERFQDNPYVAGPP